ncbi:hypothetical protein BS47DRAFT_1335472 [Hydnum rufescens UP504]|uniref:Uncharacterized protein n=1 Tax=Hydnum rufescens UP504 TaxID=1448309 RepID=A0A9P6BB56_9AGAM|nr:hypothetical protein BS47DRAFT_1335472 [Hydnum rufescens UP504]
MQARASWSSSPFFSALTVLYKVLNWGLPWSNTHEICINPSCQSFCFLFLSRFHTHFG